jgi:hypothetical protein
MTSKSSQGERPLPRFSGFTRGERLSPAAGQEPEGPASGHRAEDGTPPASRIEQVIRDGALTASSSSGAVSGAGLNAGARAKALPGKVLEELQAAQDQLKSAVLVTEIREEVPAQNAAKTDALFQQAGTTGDGEGAIAPGSRFPSFSRRLARRATAALAAQADAKLYAIRQLSRRMRPRDWRRRYFVLLTLVHRQIFDRQIERLLFIKTTGVGSHSVPHPQESGKKLFVYQGPISRKALYWALSALPASLKHYAFVDFEAANGRTLLLAARLNFEHAAGYAYDSESCDVLELNLAQYSRSYMSCRDVRALRGDSGGAAIPSQPAVLFFPDSIPASQLNAILSQICAAQRRNPQPLYVIFENSGREAKLDGMEIFERVSLPILNRIKLFLFSPAAVAVYKSAGAGTEG